MLPDTPNTGKNPARTRLVVPGLFSKAAHFYERVPEAVLHPSVVSFLKLSNAAVIEIFLKRHPGADKLCVSELFNYAPSHFHWAGADLLHVVDESLSRRMLVLETNSCPSGQKSMPPLGASSEYGGYRTLLAETFCRLAAKAPVPSGCLAVIYDKNLMETSGYAAALADLTGEPVYLAPWNAGEDDPDVRVGNRRLLEVRDETGAWRPVRAALRYVTQTPWQRLPAELDTLLLNPVEACLAGGRNKSLAAKAYQEFNAQHAGHGLKIFFPRTDPLVSLDEIPSRIARMGGLAVIKNPYSNAGQGVWTVTNAEELNRFLALKHDRNSFLLQELIGSPAWRTASSGAAEFCQVGTKPDERGETYAFDLRFMIASCAEGLRPVALYARRARAKLTSVIRPPQTSWDELGTNLSVKTDGYWRTETERLLLADTRDFASLGLGVNELVDAFTQTVFATVAIDRMAKRFMKGGRFDARTFNELNEDASFGKELLP